MLPAFLLSLRIQRMVLHLAKNYKIEVDIERFRQRFGKLKTQFEFEMPREDYFLLPPQ